MGIRSALVRSTAAAPFYANVNDTPAYLRDTTPEVSTGNLYWTNRLIAVVADAHWYETNRFIEGYAEGVRAFGHRSSSARMSSCLLEAMPNRRIRMHGRSMAATR